MCYNSIWSTAQHSTAQHSTAQHSTAQHSTAQHSTAQHSTAQHSTAQHSTAQHSTAQHSTAQHSTAQHSTAQHSTAQHSTAQHSTAQHYLIIFIISLSVFGLFNIPHVIASLSATTANAIYGNQPKIIKSELIASNLSFTYSNKVYKSSDDSYTNTLLFPITSKLSDFSVNALSDNDFSVVNNFYDDDGDYILDTSKFSHDTPTYRWLDRNGTVIPASSYSQTIGGCSTSLNAPLTLEISSTVSVSSQYGLPNTSEPVSILKRYQIYAPAQICYLRPNSLEWVGSDTGWESGSSVPDLTSRGGGFNSKTFSKSNGFYLSSQFPTTGFVGAQFKLTMDRNVQTDYTYSIVSGSGISIDSNGLVSFTSKPTSAVTLMATDKNVSTRTISYTFTIKNWVVPKASRGTYAQQLKLCGNSSANIPAVTLLTNSPQNKLPASIVTNYYYRDVGTVFSEWGQTIKQKYSKSDWQAEWSNVPYYLPKTTSTYRYAVSSLSGAVMFTDLNNTTGYIVCKG